MDYLKTAKVFIKSINEELEIRQLSAKAQTEIVAAYNGSDQTSAGFISLKHGVVAWKDKSIDEISDSLSMAQVNEINDAIAALSSIDEKNSVSTQVGSSSLS